MKAVCAALLCAAFSLLGRTAAAHSCQPSAPAEPQARGLRFSAVVLAAEYHTARYQGHYEGLGTGLGWSHRHVALEAAIIAYHLTRNGASVLGVGDLAAAVQVEAPRAGRLSSGLRIMATFPTGDAKRGLGMGHVMLMPSAWARIEAGRFTLSGTAGYGAALGDVSTHHTGPAPLVDPMNPFEVTGGLEVAMDVHPLLRLDSGLIGAVPVALPGQARLVVSTRMLVRVRGFQIGLMVQAPVVGDPFIARGVFTLAYHL